jgi:hypothetical protein
MAMFNCRHVEFNGNSKTKKVFSLIDVNELGLKVETWVKPPYRSLLQIGTEIVAFKQHSDVRSAIRFHREIASDLHYHPTSPLN